ncbi:MAG: hypothetical protein P1P77_04840 [Spirochaetaceae bacterium]|nr:hypothetical protein [Spirochaetaceae bacterium]
MKKILVLVISLAMLSGFAFAGDNQSARYMRMLSRGTATDTIDAAYFNPAGTAFLEKGFHIQADVQSVYLDYSHEVGGTTYESKKFIPFVPAAYLGYNAGDWAAFFSYNIPEGGGSINYEDGNIVFLSVPPAGGGPIVGSLEAGQAVHQFSIGGSYKFLDMISVAALGTMSYATESLDATITSSNGDALNGTAVVKSAGTGFGGTFGVYARPIDGFDVSVTVVTSQKFDMEISESSGTAATAAAMETFASTETEIPWKIKAGVSYTFPFGLVVPIDFKYNMYKSLDDALIDSWSSSIAFRYWVNEDLEVSFGTSYSTDNVEDVDSYYPLDPELTSLTLAAGFGWEVIDNLMVDVGCLYPVYFSEETTGGTVKYEKTVVDAAIGLTYQF